MGLNSGIPYNLSSFIGYDKLCSSYKSFCLSVSTHFEPQFYHQAIKYQHWKDAMDTKNSSLEQNKTWVLTDLPSHKIKWIFKSKYKANGSIEIYKARLVTKGDTQCEGLDYSENFFSNCKAYYREVFIGSCCYA